MPTWSLFIDGDRIVQCPDRNICEQWLKWQSSGCEHDPEAKTLTGMWDGEYKTVSYDIVWE